MSQAFGGTRTIPASDQAKKYMKQLVAHGIFDEMRDVWRLGASMGISMGQTLEAEDMGTFQNVNSLDTDGIFAAVMVGLYPDLSPDEMLKKLVGHAEWGIREVYRRYQNGTLDWSTIGMPAKKSK
jgi:hypothetical protein